MGIHNLYQVDSFTKEKCTGNPAGVVSNADGLTEEQMQKIAREMNCSETAFVLSPDADDHHARIRFFTPTTEVPICGHATVAAIYVRAVETRARTSRVLQKTGAGILPVDIVEDGDDYKIIMTQGKPVFGSTLEGADKETLVSALGISPLDLDERCPVEIASTGHSKVMIGIKSRSVLNGLTPNMAALADLSKKIGCNGYFVFTFESDDPEILTHGRMFAPAIGINEDPVTGNANGPLGAYLVHHGLVPHDGNQFQFKGKQGEAIGRPGIVEVKVTIEKNEPVQVQIGGNAVIFFRTEIEV